MKPFIPATELKIDFGQSFQLPFLKPVFRIRIYRIHIFLGLPDLDSNPDTNPRIILSASKNSKKTLDSYSFATSLEPFIFEKGCKCTFKSNKQKNFF
jgi:hypothetical protein